MPLQFQTVDVQFTKGQDTRTQNKLVTPGTWDTLINYSLSEDNTPQRRDGVRALVATGNGNGLATYSKQLLTVSKGVVSSVSLAGAASLNTSNNHRAGYVAVEKVEVMRDENTQFAMDCATSKALTCYVWVEVTGGGTVTGARVMLFDEVTGAQVLPPTVMVTSASAFCPRVVYANGVFFIFYMQGTSLFCRTILTSAPTVLNAAVALITSVNLPTTTSYDACAFGTGSTAMVSYPWGDGVTSVRTIRVGQLAGVPSIGLGPTNLITNAQLAFGNIRGIACAPYSDNTHAGTFVAGNGATAMSGMAGVVIDTTWAITAAAVQIDPATGATAGACHITACAYDPPSFGVSMFIAWDQESEWGVNSLNPLKTAVRDINLGGSLGPTSSMNSATFGAGVNLRGPQGPFIAGKAFVYDGVPYLPVFVGSTWNNLSAATANPRTANTQNTFFLYEYTGPSNEGLIPVAKALVGTFGFGSYFGSPPFVGTPCSVLSQSSRSFALLVGELSLLTLSGGVNLSLSGLVRLNLTPITTSPLARTQLGESTYFAGGDITAYDGVAVVEHGFSLFPEGIACTPGGAGTGTMTDGVHQVVAIYEWTDNAGQRHQSAPSLPVTVTVNSGGANTGSIAVQVPTLLMSQKVGIYIVCFVTTAAGLTLYRSLVGTGPVIGAVANSIAATNVTVTIQSSDAVLAGNELLYTQPLKGGTTLPNVSPGPCDFLWTAQNRLWFNKSDKPLWFGFSQEYVNNVGLQFAPDLEDSLPTESGGFVAGAALDEKVIIFGRYRIYAKYGSGPTSSGGFNNYSKPIDIQSDVGCSDPLSVLEAGPGGIIFKSSMGFHVLKRDLSVEYIGDGVAAYDAATVTSAVLMGDRKEARFTLNNGNVLVFSTLIGQWSVFKYGSLVTPTTAVDAVWWTTLGRYVWIALADGLNNDVSGILTDTIGANAETTVTTYARTAWLKLGTLEGFQRVRWLYITATSAGLGSNFSITTDYDDVYGGPNSETVTTNLDPIVFPAAAVDLRHKIVKQQKCKSIAFTFVDVQAATDQPGLAGIQALALEAGLKKGVNRLPAAQTV